MVSEVHEELYAVVAAATLLACTCRRDVTCIPCRARTLQHEISARGIRIRRWRNDPSNVPRHVAHVAGGIEVQREPRPSCPGYIVNRSQDCLDCGESLALGRWAPFFYPGETVTKLRLRDGSQDFACPIQPGSDSITCLQLAKIQSKKGRGARYNRACKCGSISHMEQSREFRAGPGHFRGGRVPYGWTRVDGVVTVVPHQQAIRSTVLQLRARRLSYGRIAGILNDSGYTSADGCVWTAMAVRRIVITLLDQWLIDALQNTPGQFVFFGQAPVKMTPERMEDKRFKIKVNKSPENVA